MMAPLSLTLLLLWIVLGLVPPPPAHAIDCRGGGGRGRRCKPPAPKRRRSESNRRRFSDVAAATSSAPSAHRYPGLVNLGNTCYLNAQLQCAFHVPAVREIILRGTVVQPSCEDAQNSCPTSEEKEGDGKENNSGDDEDGDEKKEDEIGTDVKRVKEEKVVTESPALLALRHLFTSMTTSIVASDTSSDFATSYRGAAAPVSTAALCRTLGLNVYEQQDSQEFWKLLLPELGLRDLSDLYTGSCESYVEAADGSGRGRSREEPFLDVSVEVSSGSIAAALASTFSEPELLLASEGNGWKPDRTSEPIDAQKGCRLRLAGLPAVLQVHLKRFSVDWAAGTISKMHDRCKFPLVLDMTEVLASDGVHGDGGTRKEAIYDLQSVVVHAGEYGSGHYYSYVRPDVREDAWLRFDDERVTDVTYDDVVEDAFGGSGRRKRRRRRVEGSDVSVTGTERGKGWFRWFRSRRHQGLRCGGSGYGGESSSAYVLQYVQRHSASRLYRGGVER